MLTSGECLDLVLPSAEGAWRVMNMTLIVDLLEDELVGSQATFHSPRISGNPKTSLFCE